MRGLLTSSRGLDRLTPGGVNYAGSSIRKAVNRRREAVGTSSNEMALSKRPPYAARHAPRRQSPTARAPAAALRLSSASLRLCGSPPPAGAAPPARRLRNGGIAYICWLAISTATMCSNTAIVVAGSRRSYRLRREIISDSARSARSSSLNRSGSRGTTLPRRCRCRMVTLLLPVAGLRREAARQTAR